MPAAIPTHAAPEEPHRPTVVRAIDLLSDFAGFISAVALAIMTGVVVYEVVSRYVFNAPTSWVTEISTYLFVAIVFLGLGSAQRANAHVQVEILVNVLEPRQRAWLETVTLWLGLVFVAFAVWHMARFTFLEYVHDARDWGLLGTPQWLPQLPMTVGLLHAFILGVEVECRLGNAVSPYHYARGWHITATCGVFGAAAAIGRVLGLDEERMLWALGNASAQSSGLVETLGSMAKSIGVGHSARGGLMAALLARQGVEGPERPLEGPRGFLQVMGQDPDPARVTDGLGRDWEMPKNNCKPYPCGVVLNPVIDACLDLRADTPLALDAISSITVFGHPLLRQRADRPAVTSGREAQVSAQHAVAVALIDGRAGVAEFSDARVHSPDVLALRDRVRVREEAGIPVEAARLEIGLASGDTITRFVPAARGSAQRPLGDAELEAKFRTLAAHGCPGFDPAPLIAALWAIEETEDAAAVIRLAAHG